MRITDKMIQTRVFKGLQASAERLSKTHRRVATSKNLNRASDDPVSASRAMGYHRDLYILRQTIRNAEGTDSLLSYTDTILEKVNDLVFDLRNKTMLMGTDTVDKEARKAVAKEIEIMMNELLELANTQYAGRYIFAGHKLLDPPYRKDLAIDKIPFKGDTVNSSLLGNLNANSTEPYVKQITVYDQSDISHTVNITFEKTANPNEWEWTTDIGSGGGILKFNANGSYAEVSSNSITFPSWGTKVSDGPPPVYNDLVVNIDFSEVTQFNRLSALELSTPITNGDIEYTGDQGELKLRVELGKEPITVNFPGTRIFGLGTGKNADGLFKVMKEIRNALQADSEDKSIPESEYTLKIQNMLHYIDNEIERLAALRGELGVKMSRTQTSLENMRTLELTLTDELSSIEEVDMSEEAGVYVATQASYQAALHAASSLLKLPSLIDYLS
ncbi:MAG: flagellar hook-associated protein FlgL [bacterium]